MNKEEIAKLAEIERGMDNGTIKYIWNRGSRYAFANGVFNGLRLKPGQTVSDGLLLEIIQYSIDMLTTKIAIKNAMETE